MQNQQQSLSDQAKQIGRRVTPPRHIFDWWSLVGGAVTAVIALASYYFFGSVYGAVEAKARIQEMLPPTRTLTLAVMTASTTTLALMLTILGMADRLEKQFDRGFYLKIRNIAMLSTFTVCITLILLSLITMPMFSSDEVGQQVYTVFYWILIMSIAAISGLLVSIVIMLYTTVQHVVYSIAPEPE